MTIKNLKNYINNERGSGMLIIMVGMLIAAIFIALMFFDFSNVFINKRVTQTGADSAALAAAKSSKDTMKETLQDKTQEELDALGEAWEQFLEDSADSEPPAEGEDPPPPPSESELLAEFVEMMEDSYDGRNMPGDMVSWLLDHSVEVKARTAMKFFFDDDGVRDIACKAVRDNLTDARKEAEKFAKENQNDKIKQMTFIPEDFRIYVVTERKGQYTTVPDEGVPAITAESSARIGEPEGYDIFCD
ncbi:pilus assembly protein TadG-related protein [Mesobacillus subterraneus]|uniref:pilus assembly protein TadG-related protein n=1 Tax=Mesobacillus subterraneus TaxID=285983 RepID=UPI00203A8BC6|nr:pilus assembly protein TadG-related protein [Mesobacillus subterraneus]MCM3576029.1 pilus assembly protein TadG-related protein [Mesobacillus subterraneus]